MIMVHCQLFEWVERRMKHKQMELEDHEYTFRLGVDLCRMNPIQNAPKNKNEKNFTSPSYINVNLQSFEE